MQSLQIKSLSAIFLKNSHSFYPGAIFFDEKLHQYFFSCSQNNIHTLLKNMVMGIYFCYVIHRYPDSCTLEEGQFLQVVDMCLKLIILLPCVRNLIKEEFQVGIPLGVVPVICKTKCMLDELVV